ncbi:MAG: hypothetical protein CVU22_06250 [Betaproteobacteria bacterium HGW-Betaproteobacteria-16]|nr:MAG: hypothetical protein CVU22_06250 [Betaproteobacteria bacterium HGW-Betaproteobacteria-16]
MKKNVLLIAAMAMGLSTLSAQAQVVKEKAAAGAAKAESLLDKGLSSQGLQSQGLYGEVGVGFLSYKISHIGFSSKPVILRGIVGYDLYPNLAIEGMLGTGLSGGTGTGWYGTTYRASTGAMFGAYAKPRVQLGALQIFGRLGLASTSASVGGYAGTSDGAGLSYGAGLNYETNWQSFGSRPISLNADYMTYYSGSGVKYNGFTLGAGMRF